MSKNKLLQDISEIAQYLTEKFFLYQYLTLNPWVSRWVKSARCLSTNAICSRLVASKKRRNVCQINLKQKRGKKRWKIKTLQTKGVRANLNALVEDFVQAKTFTESDLNKSEGDDNSNNFRIFQDQSKEKSSLKNEDDFKNAMHHEDEENIPNNDTLQILELNCNGKDDKSSQTDINESENGVCLKSCRTKFVTGEDCNTCSSQRNKYKNLINQSSSHKCWSKLNIRIKERPIRDIYSNGNNDKRNSLYAQENTDFKHDIDKCSILSKHCKIEQKEMSTTLISKEQTNECLSSRHIRINSEAINIYIVDIPRHPSLLGNVQWTQLNQELWRLHTFSKYPRNATKSAILLAANGFAYLGTGSISDDSVICFFCESVKSKWQPSDDISQVHEQLSGCCSFVTKINCTNVPLKTSYDGTLFNQLNKPNFKNIRVQEGHQRNEIQNDGMSSNNNIYVSVQIIDKITSSSQHDSKTATPFLSSTSLTTATNASTLTRIVSAASSTLQAYSQLSESETDDPQRPVNTAQSWDKSSLIFHGTDNTPHSPKRNFQLHDNSAPSLAKSRRNFLGPANSSHSLATPTHNSHGTDNTALSLATPTHNSHGTDNTALSLATPTHNSHGTDNTALSLATPTHNSHGTDNTALSLATPSSNSHGLGNIAHSLARQTRHSYVYENTDPSLASSTCDFQEAANISHSLAAPTRNSHGLVTTAHLLTKQIHIFHRTDNIAYSLAKPTRSCHGTYNTPSEFAKSTFNFHQYDYTAHSTTPTCNSHRPVKTANLLATQTRTFNEPNNTARTLAKTTRNSHAHENTSPSLASSTGNFQEPAHIDHLLATPTGNCHGTDNTAHLFATPMRNSYGPDNTAPLFSTHTRNSHGPDNTAQSLATPVRNSHVPENTAQSLATPVRNSHVPENTAQSLATPVRNSPGPENTAQSLATPVCNCHVPENTAQSLATPVRNSHSPGNTAYSLATPVHNSHVPENTAQSLATPVRNSHVPGNTAQSLATPVRNSHSPGNTAQSLATPVRNSHGPENTAQSLATPVRNSHVPENTAQSLATPVRNCHVPENTAQTLATPVRNSHVPGNTAYSLATPVRNSHVPENTAQSLATPVRNSHVPGNTAQSLATPVRNSHVPENTAQSLATPVRNSHVPENTAQSLATPVRNSHVPENTAQSLATPVRNSHGFENTAQSLATPVRNSHGPENTAQSLATPVRNSHGPENTAQSLATPVRNSHVPENTSQSLATPVRNSHGPGNTAYSLATPVRNCHGPDNTAYSLTTPVRNCHGPDNTAYSLATPVRNCHGPDNTAYSLATPVHNCHGPDNTAYSLTTPVRNCHGPDNTAYSLATPVRNCHEPDNTAYSLATPVRNCHGPDNTAYSLATPVHNCHGPDNTALSLETPIRNTHGPGNTAYLLASPTHNCHGPDSTTYLFASRTRNSHGSDNTASSLAKITRKSHAPENTAPLLTSSTRNFQEPAHIIQSLAAPTRNLHEPDNTAHSLATLISNQQSPHATAHSLVIADQSLNDLPTTPITNSVTETNKNSVKCDKGGPSYFDFCLDTEIPKKKKYTLLLKRIETFLSWPRYHRVRPKELAEAGFYYEGYGDFARCFFCGGGLRNWRVENDVWVEHAKWFPKCAYIRQQMGQVFVDTVHDLNKTNDHITFTMVMVEIKHATSALHLSQSSNTVTTTQTTTPQTVTVANQNTGDAAVNLNPSQVSSAAAPNTATQTLVNSSQNTVESNAVGPPYSELGIITERPKEFEYAFLAERMETFLSWPRDHHVRPKELSEAGFFYTGCRDGVMCFYCGGRLHKWEEEDDVWVEHARWFPKCAYVRQQMGQMFVDTVQELTKRNAHVTLPMVWNKLDHATLDFYHELPHQVSPGRSRMRRVELGEYDEPVENEGNNSADFDTLFMLMSPQIIDNPSCSASHKRLRTFHGTSFGQLTRILVGAGFYYAGYGTAVRCFCCGGGLWLANTVRDIYMLHAWYFPHCVYIRCLLGDEIVNSLQWAGLISRSSTPCSSDLCDFLSKLLCQNYYIGVETLDRCVGRVVPDQNDILRVAIEEDIRRIPERMLCRECHSRRISILLLPCRHFFLCLCCGLSAMRCTRCWEHVHRFKYVLY